MKNIVLCGGGTGGHVIPNIALLPELKKNFDNVYYFGRSEGIEKRLAEENRLQYYDIPTVKLQRGKIVANLKIPFALYHAKQIAMQKMRKLNVSVVFSKGGYVSLPVVLAASALNIPVVCHESDKSIGLANRISLRHAAVLITSFAETAKGKGNLVHIGSPIRERVFNGNAKLVRDRLNVPKGKKVLLFVGGSSGAKAINDFVTESIKSLTQDYYVIQLCGAQGKAIYAPDYTAIAYAEDIENYYAAADFVVSRCGAGSSLEIVSLKKKVIFIPLEKGGSRGDQLENAAYYEKYAGIKILREANLNTENFFNAINSLTLQDSRPIFCSSKEVNERIVAEIVRNVKQL